MTAPHPLAALAPDIPDLSALPVRLHLGSTPLFGAILMLAGGLGPVAIFLVLSLIGWVADVPPAWFWIKTAFAAIAALALPWGWWVLNSRTILEIGAEAVTWERRTPLGRRTWQAPLAEFNGFRLIRVLPSSTSQDRVARHVVEMVHPDPDRRPRLTHTTDRDLARQLLDRLAALTGLPDLTDMPDGMDRAD